MLSTGSTGVGFGFVLQFNDLLLLLWTCFVEQAGWQSPTVVVVVVFRRILTTVSTVVVAALVVVPVPLLFVVVSLVSGCIVVLA